MKLYEIQNILDATILTGADRLDLTVESLRVERSFYF